VSQYGSRHILFRGRGVGKHLQVKNRLYTRSNREARIRGILTYSEIFFVEYHRCKSLIFGLYTGFLLLSALRGDKICLTLATVII